MTSGAQWTEIAWTVPVVAVGFCLGWGWRGTFDRWRNN